MRSGWRAFWYNNTAKLFNMSLKIPFDPELIEEDYLIEDILQRQFQKEFRIPKITQNIRFIRFKQALEAKWPIIGLFFGQIFRQMAVYYVKWPFVT